MYVLSMSDGLALIFKNKDDAENIKQAISRVIQYNDENDLNPHLVLLYSCETAMTEEEAMVRAENVKQGFQKNRQ